jgi:hypothetical protein
VTPEQLSAHRGDVRCGQCQHIFNALSQLEEVTPLSEPIVRPVPVEIENTLEPVAGILDLPTTEPESTGMFAPAGAEKPTEEVLPIDMAVDFELDFDEVIDQEEKPHPKSEPEVELPVDEPSGALVEVTIADQPVPEAEPVATEAPAPKPQQPAAVVPSFLQPETKSGVSFWLLFPLVLLLLLGAAAQLAYFLRTEISAHYPPARPWLERACSRLGCTVELPRQAELLSIEDSDLQDDTEHTGVLLLVSVLYNHAPYAQAYPLLELTLTDTYDKPVLRRTFTPQEYLPAGTDIKTGIAAGGEIRSRLPLMVAGEKPAGYRLYVRY